MARFHAVGSGGVNADARRSAAYTLNVHGTFTHSQKECFSPCGVKTPVLNPEVDTAGGSLNWTIMTADALLFPRVY